MERRFAVHAGPAVVAIAALLAPSLSVAAPRKKAAKTAFDRGLAAYKKGNYSAASDLFERSYALEADLDTLYAWAQTERKLDNCVKAIELYGRLLDKKLPKANKAAVQTGMEECEAILAAQRPTPDEPAPPPVEPDEPAAPPERVDTPSAQPAPPPVRVNAARWKTPLGLGLVGLGVGGLAAGAVFLAQASAADSDAQLAPSYADYVRLDERATTRGQYGVIAAAAGGVLLAAGIVYIVTRKSVDEAPVAVVVDGQGAAFVAAGRF